MSVSIGIYEHRSARNDSTPKKRVVKKKGVCTNTFSARQTLCGAIMKKQQRHWDPKTSMSRAYKSVVYGKQNNAVDTADRENKDEDAIAVVTSSTTPYYLPTVAFFSSGMKLSEELRTVLGPSLPPRLNISPRLWGPYAWLSLHYFASIFPSKIARSSPDMLVFPRLLYRLQPLLPCYSCSENYAKELYTYPPEFYSGTRDQMENWSFVIHNSVNRRLHQKEYTKEESQYVTALLGLYTESHTLRYLWVFLMSLVVPVLKATSPQEMTSSREREKREIQLAVFWDTLIVYLGHVCENSTASRVADALNSTSPAIPWADQLHNTQTNRLHGERLTTTAYPALLYKKLMKAADAFGVHVPSTDQISFSEQMKKNNKMTPRAPTGPAQTSYPYELVSYFRHAMGGCSSTNAQQTNTMSHQEQEKEQAKALRADDVPEHIRNFYTREPVVTSSATREPRFTSSSPQDTGKTATGRENNDIQSHQPSASSNDNHDMNHREQGEKKEEEGKKQSDMPSENTEEDILDDIEEEISPEERDLLRQYESLSLETLRKKQEKKANTLRKNNKKWYHQVWVYLSFILLAVGTVLLVRLLANNVDVNSATEKILPSPLNKPAHRDKNNNNNDEETNSEGKDQSKVKGKLKDEKQSSSKKE